MIVTYLLDTNTVSYIARGKSKAARSRIETLGEEDQVCISAITEAEIRYGLAKRPGAHALRAAIDGLLYKVHILPWGSAEAAAYGNLRAKLEASGHSLSALDMQIAAHAVAIDAVLVTNDNAFTHVEDLNAVVNWATDL